MSTILSGLPLTLHSRILTIVDEHSGGIKMTELIAELISVMHASKEVVIDTDKFLHDIHSTIKKSKVLKILDYTSRKWNREKEFIYTK
jgi:hypothetical protein